LQERSGNEKSIGRVRKRGIREKKKLPTRGRIAVVTKGQASKDSTGRKERNPLAAPVDDSAAYTEKALMRKTLSRLGVNLERGEDPTGSSRLHGL